MTRDEAVTTFSLDEKDGQPIQVRELIRALNTHLKERLNRDVFEETFSHAGDWIPGRSDERLPVWYRWLIAFAVEGGSEGWYVHVGALIVSAGEPVTTKDFRDNKEVTENHRRDYDYQDLGFVKLWSAENAQAVAREAQRFLTAARWN